MQLDAGLRHWVTDDSELAEEYHLAILIAAADDREKRLLTDCETALSEKDKAIASIRSELEALRRELFTGRQDHAQERRRLDMELRIAKQGVANEKEQLRAAQEQFASDLLQLKSTKEEERANELSHKDEEARQRLAESESSKTAEIAELKKKILQANDTFRKLEDDYKKLQDERDETRKSWVIYKSS